jgi:hypothetical protein
MASLPWRLIYFAVIFALLCLWAAIVRRGK